MLVIKCIKKTHTHTHTLRAAVWCPNVRSRHEAGVMLGRQLFKLQERATVLDGTGCAIYRQVADNFAPN